MKNGCHVSTSPESFEGLVPAFHQVVLGMRLDPMFDDVTELAEGFATSSGVNAKEFLEAYIKWALPASACHP